MCGQQSKDYANIKKRTCCSLGKHLLNSTGALSDLLRTTVLYAERGMVAQENI